MGNDKIAKGDTMLRSNGSSSELSGSVDSDGMQLASMGYTQDLKRNYSVWSILGAGFSLTNSWFGVSIAMVTGINSGGPVLLVYGIIVVMLVSICVGVSLSELASALPNAGGQYFWTNELASRKYAKFSSYLTGWFSWAGSIFSCTSTTIGVASGLVGCWQLSHPDYIVKDYHVFATYLILTWFCFLFNCYGKILPSIATVGLYCSLISFVVILATVPATAPSHQTPKFVFATFINNTGWTNSGIAFITGLINANWAFACLDCATHLAEEVPRPEKMIPIAIMGTVAIGFVTSWCFVVSMLFSIVGDFQDVANSLTGVPILQLFYNALNNTAGAIALEALIICTGLGCVIAGHTWQSRLCFSFARDRGVPAHKWLSKVDPKLDVPLNAHFTSCVIVTIVGCMYLASTAAFNAMSSACIVLLYISYAIPVVCLLCRGRQQSLTGPFNLGVFGLISNYVLLAWTVFTLVLYSFPSYMPATAGNMNYVCVVYAVVCFIIAVDWFSRGRKSYRGQEDRHVDVGDNDIFVKPIASAMEA
ncbi:choline transport protein [Aureobasidium pullulans]|uniref:Choline transport protein n=1 Tax=Aureobasidium pullulans TaxID=5580 RepID=A0A4T0BBB4_AURPU|nr:choline transport protein [Aureobasidium pullulans]